MLILIGLFDEQVKTLFSLIGCKIDSCTFCCVTAYALSIGSYITGLKSLGNVSHYSLFSLLSPFQTTQLTSAS
jgi:hypothetical protein